MQVDPPGVYAPVGTVHPRFPPRALVSKSINNLYHLVHSLKEPICTCVALQGTCDRSRFFPQNIVQIKNLKYSNILCRYTMYFDTSNICTIGKFYCIVQILNEPLRSRTNQVHKLKSKEK